MKFCLFVTGLTGSGKSTLVRELGLRGYTTYHTGDMFRKYFENVIPEDDDPISPEFADEMLHDNLIKKASAVSRMPGVQLMAVECVPRNSRTIGWVKEVASMGFIVHVLVLSARQDIRERRVSSRDMSNEMRMELDRRKIAAELVNDPFEKVFDSLRDARIPFDSIDTTDWNISSCPQKYPSALDSMVQCTLNFFGEKTDYLKDVDPRRMMERCIEEAQETIRAIDNDYGKGMILTEVIDTMWFLLSAAKALGIENGDQLYRHYMFKASVNQHRLETQEKTDLGEQ